MVEEIQGAGSWLLGLEAENLTLWQMGMRACLVYVVALVLVRLGNKRFIGRITAFDFILSIILGSVVSRAITSAAQFFETLATALVLVGVHWLFAYLSFHVSWFGSLVKGQTRQLIKDGEIQQDALATSYITEQDLLAGVRTAANIASINKVQDAYLERSGDISVIPRGKSSNEHDGRVA